MRSKVRQEFSFRPAIALMNESTDFESYRTFVILPFSSSPARSLRTLSIITGRSAISAI